MQKHRCLHQEMLDPAYSREKLFPEPEFQEKTAFWHYAPYDFELFLLEKMHQDFIRAKRNVGWPGRFRLPAKKVVFIRSFGRSRTVKLLCSGVPELILGEDSVRLTRCSETEYSLEVMVPTTVEVTVSSNELPALGSSLRWKVLSADGDLVPADCYSRSRSGKAPHQLEVPFLELTPEQEADGIYDMKREVYGWIEAESAVLPELFAGESRYEMENEDSAHFEQDLSLEFYENGRIRNCNPIAFRYFRFKGVQPKNVHCRLLFSPQQYKGAFRSSDELSAIWMHSAYTLRLNMHCFMLDGIKRDHMPWAGDLALSLTSNAYTFADAAIVKRSLNVLGCSGPAYGDINGITDFSVWWIICHEFYQLYFADRRFLIRSYPLLRERVESLIARCSDDGFLVKELEWVFIDWTPGTKMSALQILFYMALNSASRLAKRLGKAEDEQRWITFSARLKTSIYQRCFSQERGLFRADIGGATEEYTRHANLFALISNLAEDKDRQRLLEALIHTELPKFGTPFLAAWELLVLAESGNVGYFMKKLNSIWGGMLSLGASTFWEGLGNYTEEKDYCEFYGRRFGASLCHAWASGPAFLLPRVLMGLAPLSDGWKEFRCFPQPGYGDLQCTVPTPYGNIEAAWIAGKLHLSHPVEIVCRNLNKKL